MKIDGSNVIITGGASGFGLSTALQLRKLGANVGIIDKNVENLNKLSSNDFFLSQTDIMNNQEVEKAIDEFNDSLGKFNILINNAGILHSEPLFSLSSEGFKKHSIDNWNSVLGVNLTGCFYVTRAFVEKMIMQRSKGVIINISSISARGNGGQSAYSASKAGIEALTKTWSKEFSMFGIRVAAIAPGFFDLESTKKVVKDSLIKQTKDRIPLRRFGEVDEFVNSILWIIENDYFNGKILELDGGLVI